MKIILGIIAALLIYILQDRLYGKLWAKQLDASVEFSQREMLCGATAFLTEKITNSKLLPLPILKLNFGTQKGLLFNKSKNTSLSDKCYRVDLFCVLSYQEITRRIEFKAQKRGIYSVDSLDFTATSLFMNRIYVKSLPCTANLIVYPKYSDIADLEIPFNKIFGKVLTKRFTCEDPFEFAGIRDYDSHDGINAINWRASAKTDSLKVNIHSHTSEQEVAILLSGDSDTVWKDEDLMEEGISLAQTLAHGFLSQGIAVSLYSNLCDGSTGEPISLGSGSGAEHKTAVSEILAGIDASIETTPADKVFEDVINSESSYCIFITQSTSENTVSAFKKTSVGGGSFFLLKRPDTNNGPMSLPDVDPVLWEVPY